MQKVISLLFCCILMSETTFASTMFDTNGRYNYNSVETERSRYMRNSAASSAAQYYNSHRQQMTVTPYRYNSLNYTRVRKRESDTGYYSAKCTDIGDASFCQ